MAWQRGFNHQALSELGSLTARLVRLTALQQIRRGQAQLASLGVGTPDIAQAYSAYAKEESQKLVESEESVLLIVTTKESTF